MPSQACTHVFNQQLLARTGRRAAEPGYTPDDGDCGASAWVQADHSRRRGSSAPPLSRFEVGKRAAALRRGVASTVRANPFLKLSEASRKDIARQEPRLAWSHGRAPSQSELADKIVPRRIDGAFVR